MRKCGSSFKRAQANAISLCRLVRKYPSTLLYPLVVLSVVLAVGIWGATHEAQADIASAKATATALATEVAVSLVQQALAPAAQLEAVAALVYSNVSHLETVFPSFVHQLVSTVARNSSCCNGSSLLPGKVQLAPAGIVRLVYPLETDSSELGRNLFTEPSERDDALQSVASRGLHLWGPMALRDGRPGMLAWLAIFTVTGDGEEGGNVTLGLPDQLGVVCGAPCYDSTTGSRFWGFAKAEFQLDSFQRTSDSGNGSSSGSSGTTWRLRDLEGQGYRYRLLDPAAPLERRVLAGGGSLPLQPQEANIVLPNSQWVLQLSPCGGTWRPAWYAPVVAAVVLMALALAGLLFVALVSRRQHQALLEALLPREVILDLVGGGAEHIGRRVLQADTPADVLLQMLGTLLEGGSPDLGDLLLLRTSVLRNMDIYQPLNLGAQIKGANLDADVTRALMRQLGTTPENDSVYKGIPEGAEAQLRARGDAIGNGGDGGDGVERGDGGGATAADGEPASRSQPQDFDTLAGALAVILTPQPAAWYDTGTEVNDAASDAALPTADTECMLPSALTSLAAVSLSAAGPAGTGPGQGGLMGTTGAASLAASTAMGQRQPSLNAAAFGNGCGSDAVHRQTRDIFAVSSVHQTSASGLSPQGSSGNVLAYLQAPFRGATQPGCISGAGGASTPAIASIPISSPGNAAGGSGATAAAATVAAGEDQPPSSLAPEVPYPTPYNFGCGGCGSGSNAANGDSPGMNSLVAGSTAATAASSSTNNINNNNNSETSSAPFSLQMPVAAVTQGLLLHQGSGRAGNATPPPKSSLGGYQRLKRSGNPGNAIVPLSGQLPSGAVPSPFCLSATFSGSLSMGQLTLVMQEERPSSRLAGLAGVPAPGLNAGCGGGEVGGGVAGLAMLQMLKARRLSSPPPLAVIEEVERLLAQADCWQFDTWKLREASQAHPLSTLGYYLIQRAGLIQRFNINPVTLARLLRHIEAGYPDNPYHNATHAADVLQTLHVILHGAQLHVHYLDELGLLAAYFAAIIHDYGHQGLTNDFLIATSDPLAVRYNDRSPLENHHAAAAFSVLRRPELDVTASLPITERTAFRKQVIDLVLATDMKQHFAVLSHFNTVHRVGAFTHGTNTVSVGATEPVSATPAAARAAAAAGGGGSGAVLVPQRSSRVLAPDPERSLESGTAPKPKDDTERLLSLQIAIKAADLGHLGEELEVHRRWLSYLEEEFFRQGDRERELGLPISPLFDRAKQGVEKSQVGFYDFVALPLVHALSSAFPGTQPLMRCFLVNYNYWRSVDGQPTVPVLQGGSSKQLEVHPRQPSEQQQQQAKLLKPAKSPPSAAPAAAAAPPQPSSRTQPIYSSRPQPQVQPRSPHVACSSLPLEP